jgi:ABC-type glycerol-3-phosphate transport system substrate-binding protein
MSKEYSDNNDQTSTGVSRRRFVQAASAAGITTSLAGCTGGGDGNGGSGKVVVSADQEMVGASEEIIAALREAGLDTDIEVEIVAEDFETDSRRQTYSSALNAGRSTPDLFMMDSGWTIPFIVREQLTNLEEELSSDILDRIRNDYLSASVATAEHPDSGDLYGVPIFPDYPVMQYRKDLVEQAGYNPDGNNWATEAMSWQEFSQVVADVKSQNSDLDYGFTTQAAAYEGLSCCTFNETMSSFGGAYFGGRDNLFGPVGDRPVTVDEEPVIETLRMMRALMYGSDDPEAAEGYEQIAPSAIVQWTEEDARGPFTAGNAVAHRNWPYAITNNDEAFGEDLGTMPLPYGVPESESKYDNLGGSRAALGGWHLTLNPNSQQTEDAVQVMEAWTSEEVMLAVFQYAGNLPPIPEVMSNVGENEVGPVGRYIDTLEVAAESAIARPVTDLWPNQSSLIYQEVHDAYTQTKTPEEAMSTLATELEESDTR